MPSKKTEYMSIVESVKKCLVEDADQGQDLLRSDHDLAK